MGMAVVRNKREKERGERREMGLREQVIRQWEDHEARDAARKAGQSPPAGVTGIRDLEYLPSGRWQHRLDVFRPEGKRGYFP